MESFWYLPRLVALQVKTSFLNSAIPGLFFCLFLVFSNKHCNSYNKYVKNIPVYGAGIWTHDLQNVSLLP